MVQRESGRFVTPGINLGVIEEFVPGPGTYVKGEGIYSQISGFVLFNVPEKRVSVYPAVRTRGIPKRGRVTMGRVTAVRGRFAMVDVFRIGRDSLRVPPITGFLSRSLIGMGRARVSDAFREGDIILSKIVNDRNGIYLSTIGSRFGVLLGVSSCHGELLSLVRGRLVCPKCGREERRKISSEYGRLDLET
ncbi:MAG: exosome complex RNA-binding protein Csl4 [Candidatus Bathyarchaeia archaeon]